MNKVSQLKAKGNTWGFTLLEILLALGLASLVISFVFIIYGMAHTGYTKQVAYSECQYCARMTASMIMKDVRNGIQAKVSNNNRLLIITAADGESIRYYLENSQVYRDYKGGKVPVAENIFCLEFEQHNNAIKARIKAAYGKDTYSLELTCVPRGIKMN